MKKLLNISLSVLVFYSCQYNSFDPVAGSYISDNDLVKKHDLIMAISLNLSMPFNNDTVLLDSDTIITYCGNSSELESMQMRALFVPPLGFSPYLDIFKERYHGSIILREEQNREMEKIRSVIPDTLSASDIYGKNKVWLGLRGRAISTVSAEIYEDYMLNDSVYSFTKLFNYANGKWSFKIINTQKEYFGKQPL